MKDETNLWRLYNLATAYGKRPSEIIPTETALSDWQLDEACLMVGRRMEKELSEGKTATVSPSVKEKPRSARNLVRKKVNVKNGVW